MDISPDGETSLTHLTLLSDSGMVRAAPGRAGRRTGLSRTDPARSVRDRAPQPGRVSHCSDLDRYPGSTSTCACGSSHHSCVMNAQYDCAVADQFSVAETIPHPPPITAAEISTARLARAAAGLP